MIRFLFRFVGILLLALAFIFVVYDGMKSIADHSFYATKISEFWTEVNGRSLQALPPPCRVTPWQASESASAGSTPAAAPSSRRAFPASRSLPRSV